MMRKPPSPLPQAQAPPPAPHRPHPWASARTLGLLRGLRLLAPFSHWTFLSLLHRQQLKLCLHLPLEKGRRKPSSQAGSGLAPAWPGSWSGRTHREGVDVAS